MTVRREEIEQVLRGWHDYELSLASAPIVDFDCVPDEQHTTQRVEGRPEVHRLLTRMREQLDADDPLSIRIDADLAYLSALMGQRFELHDYIEATQGCGTAGWPASYVEQRGEVARDALSSVGVPWGADTASTLRELEGPLDAGEAAEVIRSAASAMEPVLRSTTEAEAQLPLLIENVHVDEYWSYWLDGNRDQVRLRLNLRRADFTLVQARQFALHELLGHGLQYVNIASYAATDVPWVRLFSVHAPTQVLFEGLAQALPLLVAPHDAALLARVRLDHYLQLVRAELHVAINGGASISGCIEHAQSRVPFWRAGQVAEMLSDRSNDALLRSYLWAYPAGIDWFIALFDSDLPVASEIVHAAYRAPLTPRELTALWPDGPPIGGVGDSIHLR